MVVKYLAGFIFLMSFCTTAFGAGVGLTLQGRILKADNTPVTSNNTQFKIQVRMNIPEELVMSKVCTSSNNKQFSGPEDLT